MNNCITRSAIPIAALLAIAAAFSTPAVADGGTISYTPIDLGTPLGGTASESSSLTPNGWVAGAASLPGNGTEHAVLWRFGFPTDLGTLGGPNSAVAWPNHSVAGQVVGIAETADLNPLNENWSCGFAVFATIDNHVCLGFVWQDGKMTGLPTLGGVNGFATSVNDFGQIVGWAEDTVHDSTCAPPQILQFEAVVWSPLTHTPRALPPFPGDLDGAATSINDRGQVVGITGTCDQAVGRFTGRHAVMWDDGRVIDMGSLGGIAWNTPMDVNQEGDATGFSDLAGDSDGSPNFHAFFWKRGQKMVDIGLLAPGDFLSEGLGINDFDQVVGISIPSSHAFIWQNGTLTDLNSMLAAGTTLVLVLANEIDDAGDITGIAFDPNTGDTPAYVATPNRAPDGSIISFSVRTTNSTSSPKTMLSMSIFKQLQLRLPYGRFMTAPGKVP